jgi:hypothetical protein
MSHTPVCHFVRFALLVADRFVVLTFFVVAFFVVAFFASRSRVTNSINRAVVGFIASSSRSNRAIEFEVTPTSSASAAWVRPIRRRNALSCRAVMPQYIRYV